jgi:hypothetical protein
MPDRTFTKFSFFKVDPAWRRRDADLRAADKQEFLELGHRGKGADRGHLNQDRL